MPASVTRSTWRRRGDPVPAVDTGTAHTFSPASNDVIFAELPQSLPDSHETREMGRAMRATTSIAEGECIVIEQPILVGCCSLNRCPGCLAIYTPPATTAHSHYACRWAAAERLSQMRQAVAWFKHLAGSLPQVEKKNRDNHVRVVCLLAMCIQAACDVALREWLLTSLRASAPKPDPQNPMVITTMQFAGKFAEVIGSPPELGSVTPGSESWNFVLFRLLMRLQVRCCVSELLCASACELYRCASASAASAACTSAWLAFCHRRISSNWTS